MNRLRNLLCFILKQFVYGTRNLATGTKNQYQILVPMFWYRFLVRMSQALDLHCIAAHRMQTVHVTVTVHAQTPHTESDSLTYLLTMNRRAHIVAQITGTCSSSVVNRHDRQMYLQLLVSSPVLLSRCDLQRVRSTEVIGSYSVLTTYFSQIMSTPMYTCLCHSSHLTIDIQCCTQTTFNVIRCNNMATSNYHHRPFTHSTFVIPKCSTKS